MNDRRWNKRTGNIEHRYSTYNPYPLSFDFEKEYSPDSLDEPKIPPHKPEKSLIEEPSPLADDTTLPDWFHPGPVAPNEEKSIRPLKLLESLFSDRLSFLQRSLYELEIASRERQEITDKALEEVDRDIEDCKRYLAVLKGVLNNREKNRELERRLLELRRDRRQIELSSWRDILWLQTQSRRLRQELDSIARTGNTQGDSVE